MTDVAAPVRDFAGPKPRSTADDDRRLLAAVAEGDRNAFDRLYRRHHPALYRFAWRLVEDPSDAAEVVNEAMLVAWRSASSFRGEARVSTWLFGIAFRIARKRTKRTQQAPKLVPLDDVEVEAPDCPEAEAVRGQAAAVLNAAIASLGPVQRAVVELTFMHGLSYPEIAEVLRCPVGTVKTRMFAARAQLRRLVPAPLWEYLS